MAEYSDLKVYDEMISELKDFSTNVTEACEGMKAQGNAYVQILNDNVSMNALKRIVKTIKRYQSAVEKANQLAVTLQQERDELEEILKKSERMGEEE